MDNFCKVLTKDKMVRALALDSTDIVEQARRIHQTTPVMTAALGLSLIHIGLAADGRHPCPGAYGHHAL